MQPRLDCLFAVSITLFAAAKTMKRTLLPLVLIWIACSLSTPACAAEVWTARDNNCDKVLGTTVDAEFADLKRGWGKDLEVLAAPTRGKRGRFFLAIGHAPDGMKVSFLITESEAMCREAAGQSTPESRASSPPVRQVKGFGNDPGWQWNDSDIRRYSTSWRSINMAAPGDCVSLDEKSVKAYERGFSGQVAHIRIDGKPAVLMVRNNVHIYLMPVTPNECQKYATRFGDSR